MSLGLLHGRSRWRSTEADLRPQDAHTADAGTDLATLQWRWLPSPRSRLESVAFFSRETGRNRSLDGTDLFRSASTQWGLRADATRILGRHRLEAGFARPPPVRGRRVARVRRRPATYRLTESYDAEAPRRAPTCRTPGRASATG